MKTKTVEMHEVKFVDFTIETGRFFAETTVKPFEEGMVLPDGTVMYQVFYRWVDTEGDGGIPFDKQPRRIVDGTRVYPEDVADDPSMEILVWNMRVNKWPYVWKTRYGRHMESREGDVLVRADEVVQG